MAARSSNRLRGRTVLLLTSNRRYALRGIRPGDRLRAARRRVRLGRSYQLAGSSFYLPAAGPARGVLRVKQGRIVEIGIADPELMRTRSRALLAGL
jgi:hypothetical protein